MQRKFGIAVVAALLATPLTVQAQDVVTGSRGGMDEGNAADVAVGGVTAGVGAALRLDDNHRFNDFGVTKHRFLI